MPEPADSRESLILYKYLVKKLLKMQEGRSWLTVKWGGFCIRDLSETLILRFSDKLYVTATCFNKKRQLNSLLQPGYVPYPLKKYD